MGGDVANFKVDSVDVRLDDNLLPGGNAVARGLTLKTTGFRTTATITVSKSGATGREGFKNGAVIATVSGPFEFSTRHGLIFQAVSRDKFNSESGESVLVKHGSHLYQMNLNGEHVSAVFLRYLNRSGGDYEVWKGSGRGNPAFGAEVIYFKDGKFEFDAGRYERCDAKTGGANITYKYFDVPEFLPACGYLRDFKSGKEYYGNFDGKGMPIGRY
jgi:hypothetical protein